MGSIIVPVRPSNLRIKKELCPQKPSKAVLSNWSRDSIKALSFMMIETLTHFFPSHSTICHEKSYWIHEKKKSALLVLASSRIKGYIFDLQLAWRSKSTATGLDWKATVGPPKL